MKPSTKRTILRIVHLVSVIPLLGYVYQPVSEAPKFDSNAALITGNVCGIRVETIDDPLMQKIPYLDKLIDELAKGKPMEKILRK